MIQWKADVILLKHGSCIETNVILQTFKFILHYFFSSRNLLAIRGTCVHGHETEQGECKLQVR